MSKFSAYDDIFKEWLNDGCGYREIGRHFAEELESSEGSIKRYLMGKAKVDPDFKSPYNRLVRVKETTHPDGRKTTVDSRRNTKIVSTEGMVIDTVTDLGYGVQNVRYKNNNTISLSQLKEGFDKFLKNYSLKSHKAKPVETDFEGALRLIISDEHIGMDVQPEKSIFKYKYGKNEYIKSMCKVSDSIKAQHSIYKGFEVLFIDNLGDALDGQNKKTTRGGHILPQNMSNSEMFELFIDSKIDLITNALDSGVTKKIVCRFVVNDNHSGDFGLYCAIAIKKIIGKMYSEDLVEIDILEKFLEVRNYGNHAHVLTHGKDKEYMFKGLPLELNDKATNFINDYLDHNEVNAKYIHVDKGDLHRLGYYRTNRFEYTNFGSFAPPSAWIQHNFGDSYSCFSTQVIPKWTNEISQTNYFLDYKRI